MSAEGGDRLMIEETAVFNKGRSASICAFGFPPAGAEHLMAARAAATASTPPPHRHVGGAAAVAAAEDCKRRRPAVRSQSARAGGARSIRKKALVAAAAGQHDQCLSDSRTSVRSGCSDPRLYESSVQGKRARDGGFRPLPHPGKNTLSFCVNARASKIVIYFRLKFRSRVCGCAVVYAVSFPRFWAAKGHDSRGYE